MLAARITEALAPIHERMDYYLGHLSDITGIIADGNARATLIARKTMEEVREAVKI